MEHEVNQKSKPESLYNTNFVQSLFKISAIQRVDDYSGKFAELYDSRDLLLRPDLKYYEHFSRIIHHNSNVTDLGSGTGAISRIFSKAGHFVTALDSSSKMLELSTLNQSSEKNIRQIFGSFENFSLNEPQDVFILGKNNLYYLNGPAGFCRFIERVKAHAKLKAQLVLDFETIHPALYWAQWGADFNAPCAWLKSLAFRRGASA